MIKKRLWRDELYMLAVAGILVLLMFFWFSPGHEKKIDMMYLWPLAAAVMALNIFRQGARPHCCVLGALALTGCFWLSCVLNGDPYLAVNGRFLLGIALTFGVAYPAFLVVDKELCADRLKALAVVYILLMLVLASLALYATITGVRFRTPFSSATLGIRRGRLYAFAYHPNEVASALSIGFVLALWLCFALRYWAGRALCIIAALTIYLAISLTSTYTAMITISFAIGLGALIAAARLIKMKSRAVKALTCCLAAICAAAVVFFCFTPAQNLVKSMEITARQGVVPAAAAESVTAAPTQKPATTTGSKVNAVDLLKDLSTVASRIRIWKGGLSYLRDRPITLLIGSLDSEIGRIPIRYGIESVFHMHNIWLETLLLVGIPGLLVYLWLCFMTLRGCIALMLAPGVPLYQRLLAVMPPMLMLNGFMEIYPGLSGNVMDVMYALLCGAVIRMGGIALGGDKLRTVIRRCIRPAAELPGKA